MQRHSAGAHVIRAVVLSTIIVTIFGSGRANDGILTLSLGVERQTYHVGDPVHIALVLQNTAAAPVTVNRRLELARPELTLDIEDERGHKARWLPAAPPPPLTARDFVTLAEGQSLRVSRIGIGRHLSSPLRPGRYTVLATYRNTDRGTALGLHVWTGTVVSNPVSFEVKERSV